ncbi:MAG TPA: 4-(cytidine 5'-diphospho)-2-C-methyl-D-erythritol kinase [Gemmatimonadota bacterium]|nr:4-(cytidine 5'-diphospho)-2-C-methyl-D-erythritol kinase [Gemmatimonadota bacterium]
MNLVAPAKLNLRLRVLGRRADGFHAIETLLVRLHLADTVELETEGEGIELHVEAPAEYGAVPDDETNLCWRAARMLYDAIDRPAAVRIRLTKRIPAAAGLGGGSSDAAAVLVGLNRRLGEPLDAPALVGLAGRLGSDVPFFAAETPFALAWGRGQRVLAIAPPPSRPVLIVVPDVGISAAEAYGWWSEDAATGEAPAEILPGPDRLASWSTIERLATNDLAGPVERRRPELAAARRALESAGATIAHLCGSGSCVAAVFSDEADRDAARAALAAGSDVDPAWPIIPTWTEGPTDP